MCLAVTVGMNGTFAHLNRGNPNKSWSITGRRDVWRIHRNDTYVCLNKLLDQADFVRDVIANCANVRIAHDQREGLLNQRPWSIASTRLSSRRRTSGMTALPQSCRLMMVSLERDPESERRLVAFETHNPTEHPLQTANCCER
jgi:hypothetical protein